MKNRRLVFVCKFRLWMITLLFLSADPSARPQGFGTIVGTVTDPSGAVVAGAKVTVVDPATRVTREDNTNDQGYFVVPTLKPSSYDISISAPGFGPYTQKGVTLLADQPATANTTLTRAQATDSAMLEGVCSKVHSRTSVVREVITNL